jgi:hypothetical protein
VRNIARGVSNLRLRGIRYVACLAMALALAAGGARDVDAQAVGAENPASYVVPERLIQRLCEAAAGVAAAEEALEARLNGQEPVAKAKPGVQAAAAAVPAEPAGSALAEFSAMFEAMDRYDHAWGALILDYTGGKTDTLRASSRDTLRPSVVRATSDPDPQRQREMQAWKADLDGERFYIGLAERVRAGCPALRDGGGRQQTPHPGRQH